MNRKHWLLSVLFLGACAVKARAIPTLRWWTMDGGGGTSDGGGYHLNGTVGQGDASSTSSVDPQGSKVRGGYWVAEPLTLTLPQLTIVLKPNGDVEVSWGSDAVGYHVEISYNLQQWADEGLPELFTSGSLSYTPGPAAFKKFYRLRK